MQVQEGLRSFMCHELPLLLQDDNMVRLTRIDEVGKFDIATKRGSKYASLSMEPNYLF